MPLVEAAAWLIVVKVLLCARAASLAREPSPIRALLPLMSVPGMVRWRARARGWLPRLGPYLLFAHGLATARLGWPRQISLGGGLPNPNLFPVRGVTFELDDGTMIALEPELVKEALQYSATVGPAGLTPGHARVAASS